GLRLLSRHRMAKFSRLVQFAQPSIRHQAAASTMRTMCPSSSTRSPPSCAEARPETDLCYLRPRSDPRGLRYTKALNTCWRTWC
ncbi:hypothetical protein FRC07_009036, partial [Ceratobasidium sp. 392]